MDQLAGLDTTFDAFGSQSHQYHRNPPLGEAEVGAFEARHGVRLPDEYRAFVTRIADGGMGPDYGLYSLRSLAQPLPHLSRPFPFDNAEARRLIEARQGGRRIGARTEHPVPGA